MKTTIVGDLHLDKIRKVTYGDPNIWNDRPFELLEKIITTEKPEVLILLGDIFDKFKPDSLSVVRFLNIISKIRDTYILEGNHDRPKMEQPYCFAELSSLPGVHIVGRNDTSVFMPGYYGIGWCDTQEVFISKLELMLEEIKENSILCLHCNHSNWQNEMDNYIPKELIQAFDDKNVTIFAGHDHSHFTDKNFISLGSIMPNNIGELGEKKYWTDLEGIKDISHNVGDKLSNDVLLLREEPIDINKDKAYYIKSNHTLEQEDLALETKDLHIDIVADFANEAAKQGFSLEYVNNFLGSKDD